MTRAAPNSSISAAASATPQTPGSLHPSQRKYTLGAAGMVGGNSRHSAVKSAKIDAKRGHAATGNHISSSPSLSSSASTGSARSRASSRDSSQNYAGGKPSIAGKLTGKKRPRPGGKDATTVESLHTTHRPAPAARNAAIDPRRFARSTSVVAPGNRSGALGCGTHHHQQQNHLTTQLAQHLFHQTSGSLRFQTLDQQVRAHKLGDDSRRLSEERAMYERKIRSLHRELSELNPSAAAAYTQKNAQTQTQAKFDNAQPPASPRHPPPPEKPSTVDEAQTGRHHSGGSAPSLPPSGSAGSARSRSWSHASSQSYAGGTAQSANTPTACSVTVKKQLLPGGKDAESMEMLHATTQQPLNGQHDATATKQPMVPAGHRSATLAHGTCQHHHQDQPHQNNSTTQLAQHLFDQVSASLRFQTLDFQVRANELDDDSRRFREARADYERKMRSLQRELTKLNPSAAAAYIQKRDHQSQVHANLQGAMAQLKLPAIDQGVGGGGSEGQAAGSAAAMDGDSLLPPQVAQRAEAVVSALQERKDHISGLGRQLFALGINTNTNDNGTLDPTRNTGVGGGTRL